MTLDKKNKLSIVIVWFDYLMRYKDIYTHQKWLEQHHFIVAVFFKDVT